MSRRLNLLALAAAPALLVACDSPPSALTKAKPGECYAVVGRDAAGAAKLSKTPCAGSPAAIAAACPAPAPGAAAPVGAAATMACPAPAVGGGAAVRTVEARAHRARTGAVVRSVQYGQRQQSRQQSRSSHYARRDAVTVRRGASFHGEYARVEQDLAGGPSHYAERYERREYAGRDDYAPPPPAYDRSEHRDHFAYSGSRAEAYGSQSREYASQQRFHARQMPPPPVVYERRGGYAGGSVQYSEQQRSSSSYREESYSSSSARGRVEVDCECERGGHGRDANPSPFDHAGFLTWRGKTPG